MPVTKRKKVSNGQVESDSTRLAQSGSDADKSHKVKRVKQSQEETKAEISFCGRLLNILKYVVIIILIPPFLNYAALLQESGQLLSEGGFLYDIGSGQKLYLHCQGSGPPTVILDAPTGMNSDIWIKVMKDISPITKVCRYDRAGIGLSSRPFQNYSQNDHNTPTTRKWLPFTVERMADDLHRLVTYSSQQTRPLILVGAESGALVSLFYTQMYESDVSDVVAINPLSDDIFMVEDKFWSNYWLQTLVPRYQALQLAAATGLSRFALMFGVLEHSLSPVTDADLPVEVLQRQKHLMCNPRHLSSVVDEYFFINETLSQMRTILMMKSFPTNVSLTVLMANQYDTSLPVTINKAWISSQKSLLSKLPPSTRFVQLSGESDRYLPYKRSADISQTIKRLVTDWRQRSSLS